MANKDKGINNPFKRLKATLQKSAVVKSSASHAPKPSTTAPCDGSLHHDLPDDELFLRANDGTEALGRGTHRVARKPTLRPMVTATDDAIALAQLEDLVRGGGTFRVHESEEYHYGIAPGVNYTLLDDLKKGRFAFEHCIDLHGMTRQAAHMEVGRFISQSRCRDGASCVLVVTGRGKSSPGGTSVLREALPRWLTRAPIRAHVLAFCTARAVDGGPGAFYVLLRRQGMKPFGEVVP